MNFRYRIRKLETIIKPQNCLCGKTMTVLGVIYGKPSELTFCPKCKGEYDRWQQLTADAQTSPNLTDEVNV